MAVTFAKEKFSDCYDEAAELLNLHWDEIAPYKDLLFLNPDEDTYRILESSGRLHILTARDGGKMVGYIVMLLNRHLHYNHVLVATDDIHFLHPDYRKGSLGTRVIAAAETMVRELGAKIMVLRTKDAKNHGVLFERLGYTPLDVTYSKRLDGK